MNTELNEEKNKIETQAEIWKETIINLKGLTQKEIEIDQVLTKQRANSDSLKDIPNIKNEENQRTM